MGDDAIPLRAPEASWIAAIAPSAARNAAERTAIVDRLAVVASRWCIELLERALEEESDAGVRDRVWRALLAVRADVV